MNLTTVAENLRVTISGKEQMLVKLNKGRMYMTMAESFAGDATVKFLEINIDELKRILQDVEQCMAKVPYDEYTGE